MRHQPEPSLKTTQRLLWKFIRAPDGVAKALQKNSRVVLPIHGDHRLSAANRLDIYANMYFYRIRDSLKEDFPGILKLLGETGFHNLITRYLYKHPSTHYSLRYAGQKFPAFLKKNRYKKFPFLSDLARFEQALLTTFDAPDAIPLTQEELQKLNPTEWPRLRLALVPSFQMIASPWPVDKIHETWIPLKKKPVRLALWRHHFKVYYRSIAPLEHKMLRQIQRRASFAELCASITKKMGPAKATTVVTQYLQRWLSEGLLKC